MEDFAYEGLRIQRGTDGSVTRMYVEKGFAGNQILFVKDRDRLAEDPEQVYLQYHEEQQENDTGEGVWVSRTVQREDTDILYYGLESLSVTQYKNGILLGYDRYGKQIVLRDGESAFALKDGRPFLEIVCPDYERLGYTRGISFLTKCRRERNCTIWTAKDAGTAWWIPIREWPIRRMRMAGYLCGR